MSSTTAAGPFAGESRADAWLFEHSKFLRKHFSPDGPADLPSKRELIQGRAASGDAFPSETRLDAAIFGHSKFLRKHFRHDANVEGGIQSKSKMLRESWDGRQTNGPLKQEHGQEQEQGQDQDDPVGEMDGEGYTAPEEPRDPAGETRDAYHDDSGVSAVTDDAPRDQEAVNGIAHRTETPAAATHEHRPGATATTSRPSSTPAGAAAVPGPGLIEHHPTTMESTAVTSRPVPHSLQSNMRAQAGLYEEARREDPSTYMPR